MSDVTHGLVRRQWGEPSSIIFPTAFVAGLQTLLHPKLTTTKHGMKVLVRGRGHEPHVVGELAAHVASGERA
eukprot:589733-Heterocapsa_arctica.AAC.1